MKNQNNFLKNILGLGLVLTVVFFFGIFSQAKAANYQFVPTSGELVVGTDVNASSATTTGVEGANAGSWKGTLADDSVHWLASSSASGINMQLRVDNVALNGANKLLIQTEVDLDVTAPSLKFQICDWVTSTGVTNVADAQCTGGGWRTLNTRNASSTDMNYTDTANDQLQWHVYNGYWASTSTPGGVPIDTPLTNFVGGANNRVLIRYFSITNTVSTVAIDFLRITAIIDSVYWPADFVNLASGTPHGYYTNANGVGNSATAQLTMTSTVGNDSFRFAVPGTASQRPGFYFKYKNVKTYEGMNAILVRGEYFCSANTQSIKPYIYNFNSSQWESLTTTTITCPNNADAFGAFAKGNVTITNYLSTGASGGDIHVKFEGSANSASFLVGADYMAVVVGSVNSDSSQCEITMGTGTATNCSNTRDLDIATTTPAVFANPAEDESANMGTGVANSIYPTDSDHDTTLEEATSANINFPVTVASNMQVAGIHYAARFAAGSAGATALTVQPTLKDYGGITQATGGFLLVGATSNSATQVYTDSLTTMTTALYGYQNNPHAFVDTTNNRMNMRLRPTASGTAATNTTTNWDFAMVSLQWIESSQPTKMYQFVPTGGNLVMGNEFAITSATTTGLEGVNMGSWRGTLADDNFHWMASSTASGLNMQLHLDGVELNNANKLLIQTEIDQDVTAPSMKFQICDWASSTDVNSVADAQCTGGGWRTLNSKTWFNTDINFTATAATAMQWHIFNGYFATSASATLATINTPLTNFVSADANKRVLIRYFSTTNTTSAFAVDFLRVMALTDSVYHAGGYTNLGSGVASGTYVSTFVVGNTATGQQAVTTANGVYMETAGTAGSVADFYFSFKNVKTYTGMNTIYVKADYSCSATGNNHRPKIYKFASSTWEDLSIASIACSTTDATQAWAKNNVNINDYLSTGASGGEMRIGWRTLANGTHRVRIDFIYAIVGTTNTDSGLCEITFGTGTATDCTNTRDLDRTATSSPHSLFRVVAEDKSTAMGTGDANAFYAGDVVQNATVDEGVSMNVGFGVTMPTNAMPAAVHFAMHYDSGINSTNADMLVTPSLKDYAGYNATQVGGWVTAGSVSATAASTTSDSITALAIGTYGLLNNPEDYIDTVGNRMNLRIRTSTNGNAAVNNNSQWDFAMVSLSWVDLTPSGVTVSGTVYGVDESTPLASTPSMKLAVGASTSYSATAAGNGTFSFTAVSTPSNGNVLTIWLDTNGSDQATLVFDYGTGCSGGNCTGLSLYKNRVIIDSKNSSTLTNASLSACDNDSGSACSDTDIGFTSNGGNLSLTWTSNVLRLPSASSKFSPGGQVLGEHFVQSDGTFDGGSSDLWFNGNFTISGGVATSTSGLLRVRGDWNNASTYRHNNGTVEIDPLNGPSFVGGMTSTSTGKSFYNLRILKPTAFVHFTGGENVFVENNFRAEGRDGGPVNLRSSSPETKWFLYYGGTSLVNFATVRDSGCVVGVQDISLTPSVLNFGNNGPCWRFIMIGGGGGNAGGPVAPPDDPDGEDGGGGPSGGGGAPPPPPPPPPPDDPGAGDGGGGAQGGGGGGGGGGEAAP